VQAHTLGEVGILGTVLLRVYSGTFLPIFIEIGSYLTDKEQKISWHSFLRHGVYYYGSIEIQRVIIIIIKLKKLFVFQGPKSQIGTTQVFEGEPGPVASHFLSPRMSNV